MSALLHLLLAPVALVVFAVWAAWLALAAEAEGDLPRPEDKAGGALLLARQLHLAHLALLVLAGAAAATAIVWWGWAPFPGALRLLLSVSVVWVVGDLLPRLLASIAPDLARLARPTAARSLAIFDPLFRIVAWVDRQGMGPARSGDRGKHTDAPRRDAMVGVFSLSQMAVSEVMTPRIDIVGVDLADSRADVMATFIRAEHARLPVFEEHPDAVVGVLYAKDMLAHLSDEDAAAPWTSLIRPAPFVPTGKTLDRQLRDFQRGPSHLAVVVDEFGGTAGLITLEDILEQVVGEIHDEYDVDEVEPVQSAGEGVYRIQGGVALSELEGLFGHELGREDVSTVGGLVLAELGHVPRVGEVVRVGGLELEVEQVSRRRVRRILARHLPVVESAASGEAE